MPGKEDVSRGGQLADWRKACKTYEWRGMLADPRMKTWMEDTGSDLSKLKRVPQVWIDILNEDLSPDEQFKRRGRKRFADPTCVDRKFDKTLAAVVEHLKRTEEEGAQAQQRRFPRHLGADRSSAARQGVGTARLDGEAHGSAERTSAAVLVQP